ncbi:hypothetical protein Tco_1080293 [Tanacetum coccineum]|uniref:Retrovirus-related Pol polyprotein from transposon TNT 1-94-like beta-barrel domain-containing protein n=1 Tax=Tanacetum coccineum TaxID=301880 RepID=A0ABQ5HW83_9ASTR
MATEVPQTLKYMSGQLNAAPMVEVENFTNWKKRFKCHIDIQDSLDDEEDTRSCEEYINDLEMKFHERALLAKFKRLLKKGLQRFSSAKTIDKTECYKCGRNDEEDVSTHDNEMVEVRVVMALADVESGVMGNESAKNSEWVKISIRKESNSVCSIPLPPSKKLPGAEPQTGPKTIKSIFKSCSTRKVETPKGAIIMKPTLPHLLLKETKMLLQLPRNTQLLLCEIRKPMWYMFSGCSMHLTGDKSYLHKYVEQPSPKVVFRDDSTCIIEGYGLIKCDGAGMLTRKMVKDLSVASAGECLFADFLSKVEPNKVCEALKPPG